MRPWLALLFVLVVLNIVYTQALQGDIDNDGDVDEEDRRLDRDGDGVRDSGAGLLSPSLSLLLLSTLPVLGLRLFGSN